MTSLAIVHNEQKASPELLAELRGALEQAGFGGARWYGVAKGSRATRATKRALEEGADVVLAAGGDGTVRACAHALAGTGAALAVVPAGTANLFATALDLPSDPAEIAELLVAGDPAMLDLGSCNHQRFAVMAGTGYDAALMRAVDDGEKDRFGMSAYLWEGIREARRRRPLDVRVAVDGARWYNGPATCVLVGNLGKLKAGVVAFPDASPTDGVLEVGVLSAASLRDWARVAGRLVVRRPAASPFVHMARGARIDVVWAPKGTRAQKARGQRTPFELDGGAKGTARKLTFRCEPRALRVLVPRR
jgi:diacylglycerol kinase (ATP)